MAIPTIVEAMTHIGLRRVAGRRCWSGHRCTGSRLPKLPLLAAGEGVLWRGTRLTPVPVRA